MIPNLLETRRLRLRPFVQGDASAVLEYSTSDPDWGRFQSGVSSNYSSCDAEKFVAELIDRDREIQPNWAVTISDRVVGIVSVTFEFEHRIAVLGYGIHAEYRGNGLSGEASKVVIDYSFKSYIQLRRIGAHTDARNAPSRRVLEKLGFTCEGILRSNVFANGEFVDDSVYGLLRDEWSG